MENETITQNETLKNSIKPSISEIERFIFFLNKRFSLNLKDDLIINIQTTKPTIRGFFCPAGNPANYENEKQAINSIIISSNLLKDKDRVYITLTHELAHYLNSQNGHNPKGNYHTQKFKIECEKMLLLV